jgi:hypothetical protein
VRARWTPARRHDHVHHPRARPDTTRTPMRVLRWGRSESIGVVGVVGVVVRFDGCGPREACRHDPIRASLRARRSTLGPRCGRDRLDACDVERVWGSIGFEPMCSRLAIWRVDRCATAPTVGKTGFEPVSSSVQSWRDYHCATSPTGLPYMITNTGARSRAVPLLGAAEQRAASGSRAGVGRSRTDVLQVLETWRDYLCATTPSRAYQLARRPYLRRCGSRDRTGSLGSRPSRGW